MGFEPTTPTSAKSLYAAARNIPTAAYGPRAKASERGHARPSQTNDNEFGNENRELPPSPEQTLEVAGAPIKAKLRTVISLKLHWFKKCLGGPPRADAGGVHLDRTGTYLGPILCSMIAVIAAGLLTLQLQRR